MISPEEYRRKYEAGDLSEQDRIDEIIRLQKENKKLRETLEIIATYVQETDILVPGWIIELAKKALSNEKT